jgi:hypothetical protein
LVMNATHHPMVKADWVQIGNTPDYIEPIAKLVAVYKYTHVSGYAVYNVFPAGLPIKDRKPSKNMVSRGGLPPFVGERIWGY